MKNRNILKWYCICIYTYYYLLIKDIYLFQDLAIFPVSYSSSDSSSDESDIETEQHKISQYTTDVHTLKLNSFTSRNTTHKLNIIEELPNK